MPNLQLKLNAMAVEEWLAALSTQYPETTFRILATIPTDESLLGIVEVQTPDRETLVRLFDNTSEVHSYNVLHTDDQMVVIQFTSSITESYEVLLASGTIPQYPVLLQDGWFSAQLTVSQEQLSTYTDELATAGIPYEILSLTHSYGSNDLLTDRQWEIITEAVERGYYKPSRNCSLADLAKVFDINESSVSKLLQRAEKRIVTEFVTEVVP